MQRMKRFTRLLTLCLCLGMVICTACTSEEKAIVQGTTTQQDNAVKKPFRIAQLLVNPRSPDKKLNASSTNVLKQAISAMEKSYPQYEFQLETFADTENYINEIQLAFLSGQAYDLFDSTLLPVLQYAKSGYLADFYEPIHNSEDTEGYFYNVLDAFSYDQKLYMYPVSFDYMVAGINTKLLNEDTNYFLTLETVTYQQLLELYQKTDSEGLLTFADQFNFNDLIYSELNLFIDESKRFCDFGSSQFLDLLDFVAVFAKECGLDNRIAPPVEISWMLFDNEEKYLYENYAFSIRWLSSPNQTLFTFENPYFVHFIPLVNSAGSILIEPYRAFSMSSATDLNLGLSFMQVYSRLYVLGSFNDIRMPVVNDYLESKIYDVLDRTISHIITRGANPLLGQLLPDDPDYDLEVGGFSYTVNYPLREEQLATVLRFLAQYKDYPMVYSKKYTTSYDPFEKDLKRYANGAIKARKFAADVQNGMTLFLIE